MSTILVLDDRPEDRQLLAMLLGNAGHGVVEAATGHEALGLIGSDPPDLVITDILMPAMNGYEFVRRLRSRPAVAGMRVIFCTANYVEGEIRRLAGACGVSWFIAKPIDPAVVLRTVEAALSAEPAVPEAVDPKSFDREHLRVVNAKLFEKVSELEAANADRKTLLGHLQVAHEDERKRIAEDLHDDSIQAFAALGMRLDLLASQVSDPEIAGELAALNKQAAQATERLRRLMFELQPVELDGHGLRVAIELYLEQACALDGLAFEIEDRITHPPAKSTRALLYRLAQEALTNVRKHAHASYVQVLLDEDQEGFVLAVRDNGDGFSPEEGLRVRPGHLGLPAMRERLEIAGGSLRLQSRPGVGSEVEIRVPEQRRVQAP